MSNPMTLKTVIITGGNSGLGFEWAIHLRRDTTLCHSERPTGAKNLLSDAY